MSDYRFKYTYTKMRCIGYVVLAASVYALTRENIPKTFDNNTAVPSGQVHCYINWFTCNSCIKSRAGWFDPASRVEQAGLIHRGRGRG